MLQTYLGYHYSCVAENFRTSLNDREITEINGTHVAGKTHNDVKKLYIKKQFCPYLPLKVGDFFTNLEIFYVMNSNVQHLLNGDLDGLTKLNAFDVSHNPVEQLGCDFFKGHETIEKISFFDCHLKIIDAKALDSLVQLKEAHFQYNVCFNFNAAETYQISLLKKEIRQNCHGENYEDQIFNKVEESKKSKLSFAQRNANFIILFFVTTTIILAAVLLKIVNSKFGNNWNELKNSLL